MMQRQSGTLAPVCLNRGKHLYLLPSIEEDHYYGLLWADYIAVRARRNVTMLAYCYVIIDDVDPQLRQHLVFAECSTVRCKNRSPVFNN